MTYPFVISVIPSIDPSSLGPDAYFTTLEADVQMLHSPECTVTSMTVRCRMANPPRLSLRQGKVNKDFNFRYGPSK